MAQTLTIRGAGGAQFEVDVPAYGQPRESFLAQVESGQIVVLDSDGDPIDRLEMLAELTADDVADAPEPDALDGMSVKQLRKYAGDRNYDLGGAKSKAEILAAIRDAEAFTPQT